MLISFGQGRDRCLDQELWRGLGGGGGVAVGVGDVDADRCGSDALCPWDKTLPREIARRTANHPNYIYQEIYQEIYHITLGPIVPLMHVRGPITYTPSYQRRGYRGCAVATCRGGRSWAMCGGWRTRRTAWGTEDGWVRVVG